MPIYGLPRRWRPSRPLESREQAVIRFYAGNIRLTERRKAGLPTLTGTALRYNQVSPVAGSGFYEQYDPGTFDPIGDVLAHPEHEQSVILGRTGSGTLRLRNEDNELKVELDLPNTQAGNDLAELARRGDVSGWSVGYRTLRDAWLTGPNNIRLRKVTKAVLNDVSPVARPALRGTPLQVEGEQ